MERCCVIGSLFLGRALGESGIWHAGYHRGMLDEWMRFIMWIRFI
jgi:hypothetical protein